MSRATGRPTIHRATSKTTGKQYEIAKLRTPDSHYLPVWHYRRVGDRAWTTFLARERVETLADAKKALHAS